MVNSGFEFLEIDDAVVKLLASEKDKKDIIDFLEYAISENIVYYEALVSYELLKEVIASLEAQEIDNGVLSLSKSDLWSIYSIYDMHRLMKDEYDNFPEGFELILFPLNKAFNAAFPKKNTADGGEG